MLLHMLMYVVSVRAHLEETSGNDETSWEVTIIHEEEKAPQRLPKMAK